MSSNLPSIHQKGATAEPKETIVGRTRPATAGQQQSGSKLAHQLLRQSDTTGDPTKNPPRFCYSAAPSSLLISRIAGQYASVRQHQSVSPPRTARENVTTSSGSKPTMVPQPPASANTNGAAAHHHQHQQNGVASEHVQQQQAFTRTNIASTSGSNELNSSKKEGGKEHVPTPVFVAAPPSTAPADASSAQQEAEPPTTKQERPEKRKKVSVDDENVAVNNDEQSPSRDADSSKEARHRKQTMKPDAASSTTGGGGPCSPTLSEHNSSIAADDAPTNDDDDVVPLEATESAVLITHRPLRRTGSTVGAPVQELPEVETEDDASSSKKSTPRGDYNSQASSTRDHSHNLEHVNSPHAATGSPQSISNSSHQPLDSSKLLEQPSKTFGGSTGPLTKPASHNRLIELLPQDSNSNSGSKPTSSPKPPRAVSPHPHNLRSPDANKQMADSDLVSADSLRRMSSEGSVDSSSRKHRQSSGPSSTNVSSLKQRSSSSGSQGHQKRSSNSSPQKGGGGVPRALDTLKDTANSSLNDMPATPQSVAVSEASQSSKRIGNFFTLVQEMKEANKGTLSRQGSGQALNKDVSGTQNGGGTDSNVSNWILSVMPDPGVKPDDPNALSLQGGETSISLGELEDQTFSVSKMHLKMEPMHATNWEPTPADAPVLPPPQESFSHHLPDTLVRISPLGLIFSREYAAARYTEITDVRRTDSDNQHLNDVLLIQYTINPSDDPAHEHNTNNNGTTHDPSHRGSSSNGSPTTVPHSAELRLFMHPETAAALQNALSICLVKMTQALTRSVRSNKRILHIVHFNDVYNLNPSGPAGETVVGGASRFHTLLTTIRQHSNPLVLFSGDFMGPSLMSVETKGKQMIDAFNLLGVHYGCFGNHEFDYGKKALTEAVHGYTQGPFVYTGSTTKWIMSNMTEADGSPLCGSKEYDLVTWNGIRVGILGLCENWLSGCSQIHADDATYHDVFETGERLARMLKTEQGAEIVLAVSHCRIDNDKRVAARCPSIDLILGGHDHFYKNLIHRRVVKSGEEFQYLTEIKIDLSMSNQDNKMMMDGVVPSAMLCNTFPEDSVSNPDSEDAIAPMRFQTQIRTHLVTRAIPTSPPMDKLIHRYDAKLHERMGGVIGRTAVELDPTERCCRFEEGLLSGFVTDVMAAQMKADFALLGGAAISGKAKIPPGPITVGDVFSWFPNDTRIMCVQMLGSTLRKMLNVMVRDLPGEAPSFPHCSGELNFTIDLFKHPPTVFDIKFKGKPMKEDEWFTVAVEDFAGKGGGPYKFIPKEGKIIIDDESAEQIVFWVIDFFQSKKGQSKAGSTMSGGQKAESVNLEASQGPNSKRRKSNRRSFAQAVLSDAKIPTNRNMSMFQQNDNMLPVNRFKSLDFSASLDSQMLARVFAATTLLTDDMESGSNMSLITKVFSKLLKCEFVRIYLFDENSKTLRLATAPYNEQSVTRLALDSGTIAALCVNEKACVNIRHSRDKLFHVKVDDIAPGVDNAPHVMSMLSFPVMFKKKVLAVVQVINKIDEKEMDEYDDYESSVSDSEDEEVVFSNTDIGVALLIARQVGVQLNSTSIFNRMKRSETARDHLLEMAVQLGRAEKDNSIKKMVLKIVDLATSMLGCDRASLFLVDKGDLWTVVPSKDFTSEVQIRLPRGTGVVGHVVETGEQMNIHDAYLCKYFNPDVDRRTGYQTRTILAIPLFASNGDDIIGVLQLINKRDGTVFNSQDEELASSFCQLAAVAVHNSFEIETLTIGRDNSSLQTLPVHELTRIKIKGGWLTIKKNLKKIATPEFKKRMAFSRQQSRERRSKIGNAVLEFGDEFNTFFQDGDASASQRKPPPVDGSVDTNESSGFNLEIPNGGSGFAQPFITTENSFMGASTHVSMSGSRKSD